MNIPEEAIEAAAEATYNRWEDSVATPWADFEHKEMWQFDARLAISAAMPHILKQIVEEILARVDRSDVSPQAEFINAGLRIAAEIVEGTGR